MITEVKENETMMTVDGVRTTYSHNEVVCLQDGKLIQDVVWVDTQVGIARQLERDKKGRPIATMRDGFQTKEITGVFKTMTRKKYEAQEQARSLGQTLPSAFPDGEDDDVDTYPINPAEAPELTGED